MSAEAWLFGWSGAETSLLGESDFLLGHKRSLSLIESGSIGLRLLLVETGLLRADNGCVQVTGGPGFTLFIFQEVIVCLILL